MGSSTAFMVGSPTGSTAVSAEVSSLDTGAAEEADIVKAEAKRRESESVEQNPAGPLARPTGRSSAFPLGFEFLELNPHRRKPAFEDVNDLVANLGHREGNPVY